MVWLWKRSSLFTRYLAILLLTVLAAGCGDGRPAPAPVTGVVTYKGAPVEDAHVVFYTAGTRPAMATTDAKGQFSLLTWKPGDGALAGQAVVCVTKEKTVKRKSDDPYAAGSVSELPEIYRIPSKSPLRAEVKPDVPNEFKFDLVN
jgi:hypothetical protein